MEIRRAETGDAEVVHGIVVLAFEQYRGALAVPVSALEETVEDVRREISAGGVLLAVDEGEAVGTVRYEVKEDHLYVGRLAVLPSHRKLGVGATLMAYVEGLAPALGRTRILLATRESIPANLAFYERLGYRVVERLPHRKGLDVTVWFEKEIGSGG